MAAARGASPGATGVRVSVIAAVAENGVVGNGNSLPWRLPADLQYFKRITLGKPVVMGRKTFESIGRPLPGRSNILVSRNEAYTAQGVTVVASLEAALALAGSIAVSDGQDETIVIGGAAIYAAAIPLSDCLYITEVHASVAGDAFMPTINWGEWREISREYHRAAAPNDHDFSFVVYHRQ